MSDEFNTDSVEVDNHTGTTTLRFAVTVEQANNLIADLIEVPVPDASEIEQIHIIIKK